MATNPISIDPQEKYFSPDLNWIADNILRNSQNKGFPSPTWGNFAEKSMLVVTEVAEMVEGHRAGDPVRDFAPDGKPIGIESEIADAIIRLLDLCAGLKINIARAIAEKAAYNETRPPLHGKAY